MLISLETNNSLPYFRLKELIKYNMTGVTSDYEDALYYDDFGNDVTNDVDAECNSLYTALDSLVNIYS